MHHGLITGRWRRARNESLHIVHRVMMVLRVEGEHIGIQRQGGAVLRQGCGVHGSLDHEAPACRRCQDLSHLVHHMVAGGAGQEMLKTIVPRLRDTASKA